MLTVRPSTVISCRSPEVETPRSITLSTGFVTKLDVARFRNPRIRDKSDLEP